VGPVARPNIGPRSYPAETGNGAFVGIQRLECAPEDALKQQPTFMPAILAEPAMEPTRGRRSFCTPVLSVLPWTRGNWKQARRDGEGGTALGSSKRRMNAHEYEFALGSGSAHPRVEAGAGPPWFVLGHDAIVSGIPSPPAPTLCCLFGGGLVAAHAILFFRAPSYPPS